MRLNEYFLSSLFLALVFQGCKARQQARQQPADLEVINAYITEFVNNRKYDMRLYDPPPSPWQDSIKHNGRRRPDSIIEKLEPLRIHLGIEIDYNTVNHDPHPIKGFEFAEDPHRHSRKSLFLKTSFPKKKGIILEFLPAADFFAKYKRIRYTEGYGGFISFKNLYCSDDGKKAVFEMYFFKGRLNSSTSIMYAKKQPDGSWEFQNVMISIS